MKRTIGTKGSAENMQRRADWSRCSSKMINQILRESYRTHARDRATRMAVKRCLG